MCLYAYSMCVCVCVLSFVSSQLKPANLLCYPQSPGPPPPPSFLLLFSPISLSDEQIELLNELFLWAPNAQPQLSICSFLPSVHLSVSLDSSARPLPLFFSPRLAAATMFICIYLYSRHDDALMFAHRLLMHDVRYECPTS